MKNTIKLIGIIALAALIVFSMAACGDEGGPTGPGGGGGGGNPNGLTVTGLPSDSSNWEVYVLAPGKDVSTASAFNNNVWSGLEAFEWSNSSGNVFILTGADPDTSYWTKSGSFPVVLSEKSSSNREGYWATVSFSNGSATVPFSNFRAW